MNLTIFELIDNMIDELSRATDYLDPSNFTGGDEEYYENSGIGELNEDILRELGRINDIKERIEFALKIAVYAGYINAKKDFKFDCDNSEWCDKYLEAASQIEFQYDDDGYITSDWAYDAADKCAEVLFED